MVRTSISGMKVSFDPSVKTMIDSLAAILDVKITFFSIDKEESLVGYHSTESDYCSLIQAKLGLIDSCNKQDEKACYLCTKMNKSIIYQCHAGLTEIMLPIRTKELIGFAILGQFRTNSAIPENILRLSNDNDCPNEIGKAFLERPCFTEEKVLAIKALMESIIELQVKAERLHLKRPELIEAIYCYIDENISHDITLKDLSKAISRSESSITHRLKESTGKSFKELLIEKRLSRFEEIIKQDPDIPFKEAGSRIGIEDSLYLSRIYKRKRGITPTEYRRMVEKR